MTPDTLPEIVARNRTTFAVDVLKLLSGTTFAQVLVILAAPFLTRLYAPESWGVLTLFTSITGILGIIACLRYELAIMLPETDEEAVNLFGVSLMSASLVALLSVSFVYWGRELLTRWLNAPELGQYLWLIPIMIFIHGVFIAFNYWNSRARHFGRLSIAQVTSSFSKVLGMLGFGYAGYATAGTMIAASVAGQTIATTVLGGQIWRDDRNLFFQSIRWQKMLEGAKRHKKFPLLSTWSALMNTVSVQLPPLLLAVFFSPMVVGFYALGHRLLSMPMSMLGGAVAQVFFQRAAVAKNQGTLPFVVKNVFMRLIAIGSFPILLVLVAGKDLFFVIFGPQWAEAGVYAQILAPWILFVFLASPISTLFSVLEMQGTGLIFNSILLATRIASLVIGGVANSIVLALVLYAGTGAVMWFGLCLYILHKAEVTIKLLIYDIIKIVIITAMALTPVILLRSYSIQSLYLAIVGGLSLLLYYAIIYFHDEEIQKLFAQYVGRLFRTT